MLVDLVVVCPAAVGLPNAFCREVPAFNRLSAPEHLSPLARQPGGQSEDDASDRVGDIRYTSKFAAGWAYGTELKTQICLRVALLLTVDDRNALSGAAVRRFSR